METGTFTIKTTNLTISPTNDEKKWDEPWNIKLVAEDKVIGTISFAGEKSLGTIPVWIHIDDAYQDKGYGTEALKQVVKFIFRIKSVFEITAIIDRENEKCAKVLKKASFVLREADRRTEKYSIVKQKTNWTGVYIVIGLIVGFILAAIMPYKWVGLAIGLCVCIPIGIAQDSNENKIRAQSTGTKDDKYGRKHRDENTKVDSLKFEDEAVAEGIETEEIAETAKLNETEK